MPRQTVVDRVVEALLRVPEPDGRARVIAIAGMGGAGKSTIARTAAAVPEVQARFRDGVVWVPVGPRPDLAALHRSVAREFGVELPPQSKVGAELHALLADRAVLLVLDNVWDVAVVRAFDLASPQAGILVTSRSLDAVFDDTEVVDVPPLEPEAATALMAIYAEREPAELPEQARTVLARCGGLPLALAAAGGMAREGHRWIDIAARLDRRSVPSLPIRSRQYDESDVTAVLAVSVEMLTEHARAAYVDLGVLAELAPIPVPSVLRLWAMRGVDGVDGRELLLMLARRALLTYDPGQDTVELHDLLTSYLLAARPPATRREQTLRFVRSYLDQWGGLDCALPGLLAIEPEDTDQTYGFSSLIRLLDQADDELTIHRVLALSATSAARRGLPEYRSHLWFGTYEAIGEPSGLIRDLRLVQDRLRRRRDTPEPADRIYEWRYLLMTASLMETAARTPPPIAAALLRRHYWTPRLALTYVDMATDPDQKIELLRSIVEQLPPEAAEQVLAMVQSFVRDADQDPMMQADGWSMRKQSLDMIVTHLAGKVPDHQLRETLELVARMDGHWSFAALAPRLDDDLVGAALDRAEIWTGRDAVRRLRLLEPALTRRTASKAAALALGLSPEDRLAALVPLLRHLPADETEAALTAGFAAMGQGDHNAWLQWRVLEQTMGQVPAELTTTVLRHAAEIGDEGQRALVLAHLAPHLAGPAAMRTWKAAFTLSGRGRYPAMRSRVLALLAAAVPGDDGDLLAELLTAAMEVARQNRADRAEFFRNRSGRADGWGDHFGWGSPLLLEDASDNVPVPEEAADILMAVHDRAAPDRRVELATRAWRFSEQIPQPAKRFRLQVKLTLMLGAGPDPDRERLLLSSAQEIADPFERCLPLIDLAAAGSRAAADAAEEVAAAGEPWQRARMFPALARLASPDRTAALWSAALEAIRVDSDETRRGFDLAEVIADLPADLQAQAQAQEIFVWLDDDSRFRVWLALADAPDGKPRHLVAAAAAAASVFDPYLRALALSDIASRCTTQSERRRWADEALHTAQYADEHWKFAVAVKRASAHLPVVEAEAAIEAALSEMLVQARDHRGFGSRGAADGIRTLITDVPVPALLRHEVAIRASLDRGSLIALDVLLAKAGDRRPERLRAALRLARQSTGAQRSEQIAQIVAALPDAEQETLLAEETTLVRKKPLHQRLPALRALLPVLDDQQAVDEVLMLVDTADTRRLARAWLAEIAHAERRTSRGSYELSAVLPYLGPDDWELCRRLANAEADPQRRVQILLDLSRLNTGTDRSAVLRDAAAAARAVNRLDQQVDELRGVAALLDPDGGNRLRVEAVRVAERLPAHTVRARVLSTLIDELPSEALAYALRISRSGDARNTRRSPFTNDSAGPSLDAVATLSADRPYQAAQLLVNLAPLLPDALTVRAQMLATNLREPFSSIRATAAILVARSETLDDGAAALSRLGEVSDPKLKIRAQLLLAAISAPVMAERLSTAALAAMSELRLGDAARLRLLTSIVADRTGPVIIGPVLAEAIRLASATRDAHSRFGAWVRLLPCLPASEQREVLQSWLSGANAARLDPGRARRLMPLLARFCPVALAGDLLSGVAELGDPTLEAHLTMAVLADGLVATETVDWIRLIDTVTRIADAGERSAILTAVAGKIPETLLDHLLPVAGRLERADQRLRVLHVVARRRSQSNWVRDWEPVAELAIGLGRSQIGAVLNSASDATQTDQLERAWEDCRAWWP